jgi:hypothetical protein
VCIYNQENLSTSPIDLEKYCIDKDIEVCGIQLYKTDIKICILAIYVSPTGKFSTFLTNLGKILQSLFNSNSDIILCGDLNINFLQESNRTKQLNALLQTFNLQNIINFPTRIGRSSSTATDPVFIDISSYDSYQIFPLCNGLSDHEAQLLSIVKLSNQNIKQNKQSYRKFDNSTTNNFLNKLSQETWDLVVGGHDANSTFNSFLNSFLMIFNSCFPIRYKDCAKKENIKTPWMTKGIKVSCKHKRELYKSMKNSKNVTTLIYYKSYCKILTRVITTAKKMNHDNNIKKSQNKAKTTWKIVNHETGRTCNSNNTKKTT